MLKFIIGALLLATILFILWMCIKMYRIVRKVKRASKIIKR